MTDAKPFQSNRNANDPDDAVLQYLNIEVEAADNNPLPTDHENDLGSADIDLMSISQHQQHPINSQAPASALQVLGNQIMNWPTTQSHIQMIDLHKQPRSLQVILGQLLDIGLLQIPNPTSTMHLACSLAKPVNPSRIVYNNDRVPVFLQCA